MNVALFLLLAATSMRPEGSLLTPGVRDVSMRVPRVVSGGGTPAPTVTIDAQPYTRTTTCTGSYALTGTATDVTSVAWAASPSGESGACTGTTSWSCTVSVSPDATGEGVETITVTATGAGGTGDDTETIGFYVAGAHSCFLAQSVDGSYNSTLSDNDAVATWENLGSSALDVTQGTGTAQPTFKTAIVDGNPVVRCDGGDQLQADTASDWDFLGNGTDVTVEVSYNRTANFAANADIIANRVTSTAGQSFFLRLTTTESARMSVASTVNVINFTSANGSVPDEVFHDLVYILDDDGGAGADATLLLDGSSIGTAASTAAYPTSANHPLSLCSPDQASNLLTGDMWRVTIYQSALTATQQGINIAVDEWAFGSTYPVTAALSVPEPETPPLEVWTYLGNSLTSGTAGVTNWPTKMAVLTGDTIAHFNYAQSGSQTSANWTQWLYARSKNPDRVFIMSGINDVINDVPASTAFANLEAVYTDAQSRGVQVVVMTHPPFGNYSGWTSGRQTELESLNAMVASSSDVDLVVDLYPLMGDANPEELLAAYDNGDGLHPSEAGTTFIADTVYAALGL